MAVSFLLGAVPCGYLIVRWLHHADVRQLGSGNIGMANVWRNFGAAAGLATLVLDAAKGLAPVLAGRWLLGVPFYSEDLRAGLLLSGLALAAILGHTFTPFLRFRGGKGIATGLGVSMGLLGVYVLIPLAVFAAVLAAFRFVSLGSLCAALALLLTTLFADAVAAYLPLGIAACALVVFTHRDNIARLLRGEERRIGASGGAGISKPPS